MKVKLLIATALMAISTFTTANVMMEMFQMGREVSSLLKADSSESFQQGAEKFLVAAKKAQKMMPSSIDEDDQEKFKGYQKGMQEVIDEVEKATELAKAGKLDEAKKSVEKILILKKMYHSEYK
ncbi:cytochrome B562 [Vespertiliibacter pulmonis]|uniref:Soluble cytochrome b562 n=2 Tax=Vespertiliibacter pulmonis TaxID=1443036 RepID=A0A3N4VQJ3_9PAST|nr:cytochrome b562 [Vespertiliibacter pulmonis]QLB21067.1 cytochrome B562 [Vespertiliibacter pulmonis]RPE83833.1 soluble cytochrome b562 [Vespertiliibacter pulmonis]